MVASDSDDGVNGGLIGGIIAALIILGLAILAAVLLARRYGCCCCVTPVAAGTTGAAAAVVSTGVYEAPLPFKKGAAIENNYNPKGPGYTDLAFDNNAYATEADMYLRPPPEAPPPAYCEAEPVYGNVEPPVYDNIEYSGGKPVVPPVPSKAPPVPSKAPSVSPNIHTEYEGAYEEPIEHEMIKSKPIPMSFSNNGYGKKLPTSDDIILAKSGLKPTGAKLS